METAELAAVISLAHFRRDCMVNPKDLEKALLEAQDILNGLTNKQSIKEGAKDERVHNEPIAEINKITCTSSYQTVVKKTIPEGKTGYISKVEFAAGDYDLVQFQFFINSKVVELESVENGRWEDILLPSGTTETWHPPGLEIKSGKFIEIKAKDDGTGTAAWGSITGLIR